MRPALLLILPAFAASVASADEAENLKRLGLMPLEQRVYLSEVLARFDALPSDEKAAVRAIDEEIAKLDPAVRDRYRLLLRRYYVWAERLDEGKKKQLAEAGSAEARLKLVNQWRKAERDAATKAKAGMILGVHASDLGTVPPFEMANALRVWFGLDQKDRDRIERMDRNIDRFAEIRVLGQDRAIRRLEFQRFSVQYEDTLIKRLEDDPRIKSVFPNFFAKKQAKKQEPAPTKGGQLPKAETAKVEPKAAPQAKNSTNSTLRRPGMYNPLHQLAEAIYFNEHPPDHVSPENLVRFEAMIPGWLRATLDPLPPEDARRRLEILYRQIYPLPAEVPKPTKAETPKAKEAPKAPPTKGGGAPSVPF